MTTNRQHAGFTLVEILVVITIIGMLAAISLPALSAARESARSSVCQSNLRQFGIGLAAVAERRNVYCTGAFDWKRDGAVTEFGWVADLMQQGTITGQMLCPSNPNRVSETFEELLTSNYSLPDTCSPNLAGNPPRTLPDGTQVANPCRNILVNNLTGEARRAVVEQDIFKTGYNTNYTASWFLVRSEVSLDGNGNFKADPAGCATGNKERTSTIGPLKSAVADSSGAPTSQIPFLGCGRITGKFLSQNLGSMPAGEGLVESFTDGPVENLTMQAPPAFPPGTPYASDSSTTGWWETWSRCKQDYRDFGPVHGRGRSGACNVLFADGSVRPFLDGNGDGVLNNGFRPAMFQGSGSIEFIDDVEELPKIEVYSAWSLRSGY